jgi:CubicO group peptidase (beta-lactamase class C family)
MTHLNNFSASEPVNTLPSDLSARIETLVAAHLGETFPAATLLIAQDGEVQLNAAWGVIDPDTRTLPTRTDTLFDLASVTKLFANTAFLTLVSEDKVGLDDALVSVVPEFGAGGERGMDGGQDPMSKAMFPIADHFAGRLIDPAQVTFRQLLTHTSGLAPWRDIYRTAGPVPAPPTEPEPVAKEIRWKTGIERICQSLFVDEPGRAVHYSDLGIMLVSEALARLHGTPNQPEKAIEARVLQPLGLSALYNPVRAERDRNTIAPTEFDADWRKRRVWGEVHDENTDGVGGVSGHAGLFASARDVAALGQAWLDDDPRLNISREVMDDARREQIETDGERRGIGWVIRARQNSSAGHLSLSSYGHTGFTGTSLWIDPERRVVVACLTNRVYDGRDPAGISAFRTALHDLIAEGYPAL